MICLLQLTARVVLATWRINGFEGKGGDRREWAHRVLSCMNSCLKLCVPTLYLSPHHHLSLFLLPSPCLYVVFLNSQCLHMIWCWIAWFSCKIWSWISSILSGDTAFHLGNCVLPMTICGSIIMFSLIVMAAIFIRQCSNTQFVTFF